MGLARVKTGMQVEIDLVDQVGYSERQVIVIVPDEHADYEHGLLGEGTPLARALMGKTVGEEIPYRLDTIVSVRILAVRSVDIASAAEAASKRKAEYRKAIEDLDKRNAAAFAASFSGKWGDYDPDGIEKWDKDSKPDS
jgi:hypothetical protein